LEVHLFDFDGDLYGAHLQVEFRLKLREEQRFESFDALKEQIARDAAAARQYLSATTAVDASAAMPRSRVV
jgi:riboflavin kinase/FMN adenylyltransferase